MTTFAPVAASPDTKELAETDLIKLLLNYGTGTTITLAAASLQVIELAYMVE